MDPKPLAAIKLEAETRPVQATVHVQLESVQAKLTRDGKPFLEMHFLDATGGITLRIWSDHSGYNDLATLEGDSFYELTGEFFRNGTFGIDARKFQLRE